VKIAIFSDIHGNIRYFRACVSAMSALYIDKYFFLGDAVGYMPYSVDVLELLDSLNAMCLMGNHEAMLCDLLEYSKDKEEVYQIKRAASYMPAQLIRRIKTWLPYNMSVIDKKSVLFVHGSPWNPLSGYVYPDSPDSNYDNPRYDFVFLGHSHRPCVFKNGHTTMINVGSCGLPRDCGNMPSFVVWDTAANDPEIIRIKVDVQELLVDLQAHNVHNDVLACLMRQNSEEKYV
jgi:predicted phosphodiesterase